jgi:transcriptional regulator with XRE-family HTH domain
MNIENRLKYIRKQLGFTQESFAKSIGLNRDNITNLESGKVKISILHALALEYVHGINKEWLLNGEGPMLTKDRNQNENEKNVIEINPSVQILHEAIEETGVKLNEKQKQAFIKIISEELDKSDRKTKEDIKKYLQAFGE